MLLLLLCQTQIYWHLKILENVDIFDIPEDSGW